MHRALNVDELCVFHYRQRDFVETGREVTYIMSWLVWTLLGW